MAKRKPATTTSDASSAAWNAHYTVLARRYRPQQFDDLIGQDHVAQSLTNALKSNRVAHAYLFTGARGVGKTSTARILSKALNCEKGPTVAPCDQCEICESIAAGDDVDVLEIDGASNRGIDEVREIRQNVQFRPSRSRHKIYIIDEVHMLTPAAFNALLKTLEEPPPHVKFIFATTEAQKIPITILSRCQRFDFAGITVQHIAEQLRKIVANEGMDADDEALELIARRAGGSMRDAESLLDQLLAFEADKLTIEHVHGLLGTAHDERVATLAEGVLGQDAKLALELLDQAVNDGLDLSELLGQLIEYWRDLMVVHCAGSEGQNLSVSRTHRRHLEEQAQQQPLDTILAGLDVLVAAKLKFARSNQNGRVLVESALVRLSRLGELISLSQMAEWLKGGPPFQSETASAAVKSGGAERSGSNSAPRKLSETLSRDAAKRKPAVNDEAEASAGPIPMTDETLPQVWTAVLTQLSSMFANELRRSARVAIFGPNALEIRFPSSYNLMRDRCKERLGDIEEALKKVTGRSCNIRIESSETTTESTKTENPSGNAEDTGAPVAALEELPLVRRAMQVLGAQVRRADSGFGQELKTTQADHSAQH